MKPDTFKIVRADGKVVYEGPAEPFFVEHGDPSRWSYEFDGVRVEGLPPMQNGDSLVVTYRQEFS